MANLICQSCSHRFSFAARKGEKMIDQQCPKCGERKTAQVRPSPEEKLAKNWIPSIRRAATTEPWIEETCFRNQICELAKRCREEGVIEGKSSASGLQVEVDRLKHQIDVLMLQLSNEQKENGKRQQSRKTIAIINRGHIGRNGRPVIYVSCDKFPDCRFTLIEAASLAGVGRWGIYSAVQRQRPVGPRKLMFKRADHVRNIPVADSSFMAAELAEIEAALHRKMEKLN